ncbi:MAG: PilZ domain-containing protein [Thioalkalispiraceae bacterium]|jgi:hypothetical protein
MRSYIRHPADIPLKVALASEATAAVHREQRQQLSNISSGGLAFSAPQPFETGNVIELEIDVVQPPFKAKGLVTHCHPDGDHYVIGIEFISKDTLFVARMVEQICHIEHYKREIELKEGRTLTGEEAAKEWIERYAANFPQWQANG